MWIKNEAHRIGSSPHDSTIPCDEVKLARGTSLAGCLPPSSIIIIIIADGEASRAPSPCPGIYGMESPSQSVPSHPMQAYLAPWLGSLRGLACIARVCLTSLCLGPVEANVVVLAAGGDTTAPPVSLCGGARGSARGKVSQRDQLGYLTCRISATPAMLPAEPLSPAGFPS